MASSDASFLKNLFDRHQVCPTCLPPENTIQWFNSLLGTLYPDFSKIPTTNYEEFKMHFKGLETSLASLLQGQCDSLDGSKAAQLFFETVQEIFEQLENDVRAIYDGDPAAKSKTEVIKSYPGFYAIAAHRVAHVFEQLNITLIPRILSEHAHSKTGIDIHPGAKIGSHFCIDHGTGVVIGETTNIGNYVKIYQGVTLGARSVDKADAKKKRHPTIEDHVVIYSGATILGGNTIIGHHSIIGGNVWITDSVPSHSKIYYNPKGSEDPLKVTQA